MYVGGSNPDQQNAGQFPDAAGLGGQSVQPTPDFVRAIGRQGMQMKSTLQTLSGQHPEAADEFRKAIQSIDAGIAKILTTNPQATGGGPPAPRNV